MSTLEGFQLSPQQKRLWLIQDSENVVKFRTECTLLLEGELIKETFENALLAVVGQYEILRTIFHQMTGMTIPVQVIQDFDERTSCIAYHDLSILASNEQQMQADSMIREMSLSPFDIEIGPLLRVGLFRLSPVQHLLHVSLPALCGDGETVNFLIDKLIDTYASSMTNIGALDEVLQYADYSEWCNGLFDDEVSEEEDYWQQLDFSALHAPKLPCVSVAPQSNSQPRDVEHADLSIGVERLKALMDRYDVSLSAISFACWQIVLWRLTGECTLMTGLRCDGRNYEELQRALGLFAKFVPISAQLDANLSFGEFVTQIQEQMADAYEMQEYFNWERIDAEPNGSFANNAFDFCFDFTEAPPKLNDTGLAFTIKRHHSYLEPFTLNLHCVLTAEILTFEFNYDTLRLRHEDVVRIEEQFITLLEDVIDNPEHSLGQLNLLNARQKKQLLADYSNTLTTPLQERAIHHLIEEQAMTRGGEIAVVYEERQLSYAELNMQANHLAYYLRRQSIGPEARVGIYLERSVEMIVGVLAIWKAGGVYVPMMTSYPKERLAMILADGQIALVLTQQSLLNNLTGEGVSTLCVDKESFIPSAEQTHNPTGLTEPENLAYIIYTSGSTGRPKGVMIQHRSVVNLAAGLHQAVYGGATEVQITPLRVSLNAPLAFDSSVKQLVQLAYGHTLYIVPDVVRMDDQALLAFIEQHQLDVLDCTPVQLELLLAAGLLEREALHLQALLVGGEAISTSTWCTLVEHVQQLQPYNVYGPTECTVDATTYSFANAHTAPTIGRPLTNVQSYILDDHLQPAPIGVVGEIYLGGMGIARGYVNRPAHTAESFIPHPFSETPGCRLYKTGDLACFLPDGNIEYVGRRDRQVKLRGNRIELGEIEALLQQHPGVQQVVTVVREDTPGTKQMVAYWVAAEHATATARDLRTHLQETLPDYMIPDTFVPLDTLPLTPNGKVNFDVLPTPKSVYATYDHVYIAPQTPDEEFMIDIWTELLNVEQIGLEDNFFELGGHSLVAIQLLSRIRDIFRVEISLQDIFDSSNVTDLAKKIDSARRQEQGLLAPAHPTQIPQRTYPYGLCATAALGSPPTST